MNDANTPQPAAANVAAAPQAPAPRTVSAGLAIGIVFLPWIFSWFTLRQGHSTVARVVSLGYAGVLFLMVVSNQHQHDGSSSRGSAGVAAEAPEVLQSVEASQLVATYDGNELAGDQKYKGHTYLISGVVESVGKDIMSNEYVNLQGGNPVRNVQCFLKDNDEVAKAISLAKGQSVKIVGTVDGLMMNVLVKDAEIK